jgi:mannose-6-phosphate isomerase-like protein (cupin superfamily)
MMRTGHYGDSYGQDYYGQENYRHDNTGYDNYCHDNTGYDNYSHDNTGYDNYSHDNYSHDNTSYDNTGHGAGYGKKKDDHKKQGDFGPRPFVVNINSAARHNKNYRTTLWTGPYLQLTLMSINDEIGLEVHHDTDQFIRIEEGYGLVMMGSSPENLSYRMNVGKNSAIFVPAGTWHNLVNCGPMPVKLYTIYAPPHHEPGTIHPTRKDAMEDEH